MTSTDIILHCTQCGGELHPETGQLFLTCPYCAATVYLDASRVVFHWYVAPTISAQEARGILARWMAGDATVKDLDRKATVDAQTFQYFPLWYFKYKQSGGEQILLEPAAATTIGELRSLNLPGGDLKQYDASLDAQAALPNVPLPTAQGWLQSRGVPPGDISESALVHVPLYAFKYTYNRQSYTAIVEAATGRTLAAIYPAKAEAPFMVVGIAGAVAYLAIALCSVVCHAAVDGQNLLITLAVCAAFGLIAAPVLFAAAARVAATV
jgi:hypothetical protein